MDGEQGRLTSSWRNSLQLRLSLSLSAVVMILAIAAGVLTFLSTYREISALQDTQLKQVAEIVTPYSKILREENADGMTFSEDALDLPEPRFLVRSVNSSHINRVFENPGAQAFLSEMRDGLHDFELSGYRWRIYLYTYDKKHRIIAAERALYREQLASEAAWHSVIPWVALIPILWLLIALVVHRMFHHFKRAARELDQRGDHDLQALSGDNLPGETYVFINAINRLLARLNESFASYRRFIGDAAHELRTPVTALSLQAAGLDETDIDESERIQRIRTVQDGVRRMQNLLTGLLTLARIRNRRCEYIESAETLPVLRHVIEDIMPAAQERSIDLGVLRAENCCLTLPEIELHAVFKNLIENAVRYTPCGGQVDVEMYHEKDCLLFCVADSGKGVSKAEQKRIFEPFYRGSDNTCEGCGLGLSIVKNVCEQYDANIQLGDSPLGSVSEQCGLMVTVVFPKKILDCCKLSVVRTK